MNGGFELKRVVEVRCTRFMNENRRLLKRVKMLEGKLRRRRR
jgi:hypothetical protein